jgi:hypothetical protein
MQKKIWLWALILGAIMVVGNGAWADDFYVIPGGGVGTRITSLPYAALLTVYRGEEVEILERMSTGWSKVRLVDRSAIAWIPSDFLSCSSDLRAVPVPPYYVNVSSVPLRDKPNPNANVLTTLHFHDPVEMLGVGPSGWAQVRDLRSSRLGWVEPRYLSPDPPSYPGSSPPRRAPARKAPPKEENKAPEETPSPPSPM